MKIRSLKMKLLCFLRTSARRTKSLATQLRRHDVVVTMFVHNVTLWHFRITSAAMKSQQCVMCVLLRYMYDESMSPATIKRNSFSCKMSDILFDFNRI